MWVIQLFLLRRNSGLACPNKADKAHPCRRSPTGRGLVSFVRADLKVAKAMRRYASGGAPAQRLADLTGENRVILHYPHETAMGRPDKLEKRISEIPNTLLKVYDKHYRISIYKISSLDNLHPKLE